MITLEVTISPDYVEWGIWEALRELMQNARDAHEQGMFMSVNYFPATKTLWLSNRGASLGRETLVLGGTTKRNDSAQRGQFGEGYKLAIATLLREGCSVKVKNGGEIWTPSIGRSEAFNTDVLKVDIDSVDMSYNGLLFEVKGIAPEQYADMVAKLLFLRLESRAPTESGRVLRGAAYNNKLFVKGIYVNEMPSPCRYGYDLSGAALNRDRTLAEPYELKRSIVRAICESVESGVLSIDATFELLIKPMNEQGEWWFEEEAFRSHYFEPSLEFAIKLTNHFEETFGVKAIPVISVAQMSEAGHYGKVGVMTSIGLARQIARVRPDFKSLKNNEGCRPKEIFEFNSLTTDEKLNLAMAVRAVLPFENISGIPGCPPLEKAGCQLSIVEFKGPDYLGLFRQGPESHEVYIARKLLTDLPELIATLIHEVAHKYGADGDVAHFRAYESLSGKVIARTIS